MGTKRKKPINWPARRLLAENVTRLRDRRYSTHGDKNSALAKDAGHSLSTIQRMMNPDGPDSSGIGIDIIADVAAALGCQPCALLLPRGFTLVEADQPGTSGNGPDPTSAGERRIG